MVRFWIVTVMAALGSLIATVGAALSAGAVVGIVGEYALGSGTFKLEIDADEDLRYAVIVCDETDPSCKNWRRSG